MKRDRKILTDYELEFLARTGAARAEVQGLTQAKMARLLKIAQDTYKMYEIRSLLPHEHVDAFLTSTGVPYEWLFSGDGKGPQWHHRLEELKIRQAEEIAKRAAKKGKRTG